MLARISVFTVRLVPFLGSAWILICVANRAQLWASKDWFFNKVC